MSHVFISYSHEDQAYVEKLCDELKQCGFAVWTDKDIPVGDDWNDTIDRFITKSMAVIVVMTPAAATSKWVKMEISRAKSKNKPLFPILLDGSVFPSLSRTQYVSVEGGELPPPAFFCRLVRVQVHVDSFYAERGELDPLADTLDRAKKDILAVGITLRVLAQDILEGKGSLDQALERGCKVRLLFLTPYTFIETPYTPVGECNPVMGVSCRQTRDPLTFDNTIDFIQRLVAWKKTPPKKGNKERKNRLEIKGFDNIPATTALLIDADSRLQTAMIHVEPIMAELTANFRPSFEVTRRSCPDLFDALRDSYERLWDRAIDVGKILALRSGNQEQCKCRI